MGLLRSSHEQEHERTLFGLHIRHMHSVHESMYIVQIPFLRVQEEDILTEGSEVERPQGTAEGLSEIGSERRYATRQSTRNQQGSQPGSTEPDKVSSTTCVVYILHSRAHIRRKRT